MEYRFVVAFSELVDGYNRRVDKPDWLHVVSETDDAVRAALGEAVPNGVRVALVYHRGHVSPGVLGGAHVMIPLSTTETVLYYPIKTSVADGDWQEARRTLDSTVRPHDRQVLFKQIVGPLLPLHIALQAFHGKEMNGLSGIDPNPDAFRLPTEADGHDHFASLLEFLCEQAWGDWYRRPTEPRLVERVRDFVRTYCDGPFERSVSGALTAIRGMARDDVHSHSGALASILPRYAALLANIPTYGTREMDQVKRAKRDEILGQLCQQERCAGRSEGCELGTQGGARLPKRHSKLPNATADYQNLVDQLKTCFGPDDAKVVVDGIAGLSDALRKCMEQNRNQ